MPATCEYIDFEGPPDRLQITKIGGYPTGLGSEPSSRADIIPHIMASFGNGGQAMACSAIDSPINRRYSAPRTPFGRSIRPPATPAQIHVLRSCVFLRKYCQNLTVSLGGYPWGYIAEPQQSSSRPSARPGCIRGFILGRFLGLPAGLSLDLVRFQLLPLWPRRDHTPACGGSATPKATILTRTHLCHRSCHLSTRCVAAHAVSVLVLGALAAKKAGDQVTLNDQPCSVPESASFDRPTTTNSLASSSRTWRSALNAAAPAPSTAATGRNAAESKNPASDVAAV